MGDSGQSPIIWLAPGTLTLESGGDWLENLGRWCESLSDRGVSGVFLDGLVIAGSSLDPFAVAGALSATVHSIKIGVTVRLGHGRAASVAVREATCVDLLASSGSGLLLSSSSPMHLEEGSRVAAALLEDGLATVDGSSEHVASAPNRPGPSSGGDFEIIALLETAMAPRVSRVSGSRAAIEVESVTDEMFVDISRLGLRRAVDLLIVRSATTPLDLVRLMSGASR